MQIGKPVRTLVVEPLRLPLDLCSPERESESAPVPDTEIPEVAAEK